MESTPPAPLLQAEVRDWLGPESTQHQGLLMERRPWWGDCQDAVDRLAASGDLGDEDEVVVRVSRGPAGLGNLRFVADKILGKLTLPQDVKDAFHADICQLGAVVEKMCPWSDCVVVKLELIGEKACSRWHRDYYCGRAIVSYNAAGTLYTPDENVNFWELENKGGNERIIRRKSEICAAGVGDVLFIKGVKYPDPVKGLVHRSPEVQYHCNGHVVNRLVLKIDVPEPEAWKKSDCDCCP